VPIFRREQTRKRGLFRKKKQVGGDWGIEHTFNLEKRAGEWNCRKGRKKTGGRNLEKKLKKKSPDLPHEIKTPLPLYLRMASYVGAEGEGGKRPLSPKRRD